MTHNVFCYGSLKDWSIRGALLGRHVDNFSGYFVKGYRRYVSRDGYFFAWPCSDEREILAGFLISISDSELELIDQWEATYTRSLVKVWSTRSCDPIEAWIYMIDPATEPDSISMMTVNEILEQVAIFHKTRSASLNGGMPAGGASSDQCRRNSTVRVAVF